tara:strand:- start:581 stop:703 length:123 start_codon:yes stop_codon:yes gene_type:complete
MTENYDYIIIGTGTAGCILTNILNEKASDLIIKDQKNLLN